MSTWSDTPKAMQEFGEQLAPKLQDIEIKKAAAQLEALFLLSDTKKAMQAEADKHR